MKLLEKIKEDLFQYKKYTFTKKYFPKNKKEWRSVVFKTKEDAIAFFLDCKTFEISTDYDDRLHEINHWWNLIGGGCGRVGNYFHFSQYTGQEEFESEVFYKPTKKALERMREYLPILEEKIRQKEREDEEKFLEEARKQKEKYDNDPKNKCSKGGVHTITMKGNYFGYGWGECTKCGKRF